MNVNTKIKASQIKTLLLALSAISVAITIIKFPNEAFNASLRGLSIWWEIVFPALLPFLITAELLLGFGVVHFLGVLLEPLMRPLFNVPGVGAFVLAMGFSSGYPMGAKLTTRLREQNLINQTEGERLVSFTTTSDPLFLFGAISVGFFHDAKLGALIALIHYSSSIIVGLIMKYFNKIDKKTKINYKDKKNIFIRAFNAMHKARLEEKRKFGRLMGDAVMSSIETLLMIGGFIIFFSVILAILDQIEITKILSNLFTFFFIPLGISIDLSQSLIYGLFEVTLGAKAASEVSLNTPYMQKIAIVSAISAWSGISVHAQIAAIIQKTDIRYTPFLFAKILHSIIAFTLTLLIYKPLNNIFISTVPTFYNFFTIKNNSLNYYEIYKFMSIYFISLLFTLIFISLLIYTLKSYKMKINK